MKSRISNKSQLVLSRCAVLCFPPMCHRPEFLGGQRRRHSRLEKEILEYIQGENRVKRLFLLTVNFSNWMITFNKIVTFGLQFYTGQQWKYILSIQLQIFHAYVYDLWQVNKWTSFQMICKLPVCISLQTGLMFWPFMQVNIIPMHTYPNEYLFKSN